MTTTPRRSCIAVLDDIEEDLAGHNSYLAGQAVHRAVQLRADLIESMSNGDISEDTISALQRVQAMLALIESESSVLEFLGDAHIKLTLRDRLLYLLRNATPGYEEDPDSSLGYMCKNLFYSEENLIPLGLVPLEDRDVVGEAAGSAYASVMSTVVEEDWPDIALLRRRAQYLLYDAVPTVDDPDVHADAKLAWPDAEWEH